MIDDNHHLCGLCSSEVKKKDFKAHVKNCHSVDIVKESLRFLSIDKFKKWKASLEQDNDIKFIKKCGRRIVGSIEIIWFYCHQSKCYKECGKHRIERNKVVNAYCPASIKLIVYMNGECTVKYVKTHIGHLNLYYSNNFIKKIEEDNQVYNLNQDNSFLKAVLEKLDSGMKNNEANSNDSFNINASIMKLKESCCVLFYKAKESTIEEFENLAYDDFIVIVMNQSQRRVLERNDYDLVYVGGTRNIDTNGYELITLMIVDDKQQSFPCAFFISNRVDIDVMKVFFSFIKDACGILSPTIFMSDVNNIFYYAWIYIMTLPPQWFYTENSVKLDWTKNLVKINNAKERNNIYELLINILSEDDENIFNQLIDELKTLIIDLDNVEFDKYINDHFLNYCGNWAYCYRQNYSKQTSINIERMEKLLESLYLNEKYTVHLDQAVEHLLKFVDDRLCFTDRSKLISKLKMSQSRHEDSLKLENFNCEQLKDKWQITCSCDIENSYFVTKNLDQCSCAFKCDKCNCCIHKYCCTCDDNAINWNICKHIHFEIVDSIDSQDLVVLKDWISSIKAYLLKKNRVC